MRNDFLQNALKIVSEPNVLVNLVSLRVKQLKRGYRPLIESLEKLSPEDTALREIAECKITYELGAWEVNTKSSGAPPLRIARDPALSAA